MNRLLRATALAAVMIWAPLPVQAQHAYPVQELLATGKTVVGEDIVYPTSGPAKITVAIVTVEPGAKAVLHRHPAPLVAYVLEGELTVDYGDRGQRTFRPGESFVEAMHAPHRGLNLGAGIVRLLAVYVGAAGTANVENERP